jgi:hypothetical protein
MVAAQSAMLLRKRHQIQAMLHGSSGRSHSMNIDSSQTAEARLIVILHILRDIAEDYPNSGDWYGCTTNAIPYIREALRSAPPGSQARPDDWKERKQKNQ